MSKRIRILISFWILLVLSLLFYFSISLKRLNPNQIVEHIVHQIETTYPKIKIVKHSSQNYSIFNLQSSLTGIILKHQDKEFVKIGSLEIKFPWKFFLLNFETAEINLTDLDIYLPSREFSAQNDNFLKSELKKVMEIELPRKLIDVGANLRIKNLNLFSSETGEKILTIEKLLFKNLNSSESSSFELISTYENEYLNLFKFNLKMFGEISFSSAPWQARFRANLTPVNKIEDEHYDDIVLNGSSSLNWQKLRLNSNLMLQVQKESVGTGNIEFKSGKTDIELNLTSLPLGYLNIFSQVISNPFLPDLVSVGRGAISLKKSSLSSPQKYSANIEFDGAFQYNSRLKSIPGKWKFLLKDSRLETSFVSPKAEVTFFRRSFVDLNSFKVIQYFEEVGFSNVDFASSISGVKPVVELISNSNDKYFSSSYVFKNCLSVDKQVNGEIKFGNLPGKTYYTVFLKKDSSSLKMNYEGIDSKNRLQLILDKFQWTEQVNLFSPIIQSSDLLLDGYLDGTWKDDIYAGVWDINFKARNIVNFKGIWADLLSETWRIFNEDITSNPVQLWQFKIKPSLILIDTLTFESEKKLKLSGKINLLENQDSSLQLRDLNNKKIKLIEKNFPESIIKRSL